MNTIPPNNIPPPILGAPNKSSRTSILVGIAIALVSIGGVVAMLFWFLYPEYEQDQIRKNGLPAKGTIISIQDTGNRLNDQPQVKIRLKVEAEGKDPYETDLMMVISPVYLSQFQPGKNFNVKYDPQNPSKVAIQ